MPFNINEFIAEIDRGNIAKSANYSVQVHGRTGDMNNERDMMFRADSVTMPGRNIQTTEYSLYGVAEKIGYDSIMNPVECAFILSEDLREKTYFHQWQDLIVGSYRTGAIDKSMFKIGFYDDYVGNLRINSYDDVGNITNTIELIEAYPLNVGDVSRSWEAGTEALRLSVTFAYRFFLDER